MFLNDLSQWTDAVDDPATVYSNHIQHVAKAIDASSMSSKTLLFLFHMLRLFFAKFPLYSSRRELRTLWIFDSLTETSASMYKVDFLLLLAEGNMLFDLFRSECSNVSETQ